jgi:hypothetical protein
MARTWLYLFVCFIALGSVSAASSWSCNENDVQTAMDSAKDGDTVFVPTGSCTWREGVSFSNNKGLEVLCETPGACIIDVGSSAAMFQMYTLSGNNTRLYRVSGFRFQGAPESSMTIWFYGDGVLNRFRIDHNTFTDFGMGAIAVMLGEVSAENKFFGVIDHNTFSGANNIMATKVFGPGDPSLWTSRLSGTSQNVFVEDNIFNFSMNTNLGSGCVDVWRAGSIVFRNNDVRNCLVTAHGVTHATTVNFELYNNKLRRTANSGGWEDGTRLFHHQGSGELFLWGNTFYSAGPLSDDCLAVTHYRSTTPAIGGFDDSLGRCDGTEPIDGNRPGQKGYPCWMQPGRAPGPQVYGVLSPVYAWMNADSATGNNVPITIENPWSATNPSVEDHIKPDRDYYDAVSKKAQNSPTSPFDGTTGMGFGTLANRPVTCKTNPDEIGGGVGYFATDTQTLYRCASSDNWVEHYKPYTYPHPLMGTCTPDCAGKSCGDDGCGASCPPGCTSGQACVSGQCQSSCAHPADTDCQDCISITELNNYIGQWLSGSTQISDMMEAIRIWKTGCPQ